MGLHLQGSTGGATVTDAAVADKVTNGASTQAAIGNQLTKRAVSQTPDLLVNTTLVAEDATHPRVIDYWGGYWWGYLSNHIYRSADGVTWTDLVNTGFLVQRLLPAAGGEVLAVLGQTIKKSTGWTANPATATWATVLTVQGVSAVTPYLFDSDPAGQIFIAGGYAGATRSDSNKVWVSSDAGATWAVTYDSQVLYPSDYTTTHTHAVAVDPWAGTSALNGVRLWMSEGHNATSRGLHYSDDLGATWVHIVRDNLDPDGAPISLVATDAGLICGTDSVEGAVYVVRRHADPTAMRLHVLARLGESTSGGAPGQALRCQRDSVTGVVYVIMDNAADATYPVTIWATDGASVNRVYSNAVGTSQNVYHAIAHNGKIHASFTVGGVAQHLIGTAGSTYARELAHNSGNISGGVSRIPSTVVIGTGAAAATASNSLLAGTKAVSTGTDSSTALGASASAGTTSVSVGKGATTLDTGVAVGRGASATANEGTAVGDTASAAATGVAVGRTAAATGTTASTAVGYAATASGTSATALGKSANASNTSATALGVSAVASAGSTVAVGASASASGTNGTAVGVSAATSGSGSVVIGQGATGTASANTVAVGKGAAVSAAGAVAIGQGATSAWTNSVALGLGVTTSADNQVHIGTKHIGMTELAADPAAASLDGARLYIKDNGAGKTQLCVIFNTGAVQIIAQQP